MSFADDVINGVNGVLLPEWSHRNGTVVPATADIVLKDGAVMIDATYVYADLGNSSVLGQSIKEDIAAKIVRSYLNAATRILKNYSGQIRSFDGDRVMAIFIGGSKNTNAVRAALALNWAVHKVLRPSFKVKWPNIEDYWICHHGVGIDTGEAMLVRGGVRNDNDLISIGAAPNVAAKLSALRKASDIYITNSVYNGMNNSSKFSNNQNMWTVLNPLSVAGKSYSLYGSQWWWSP